MSLDLDEIVKIFNISYPWGIIAVLLIFIFYIIKNPEKVEKWKSIFAGAFAWISIRAEKINISKDIESKLNSYRKETNKKCEGLIPYKMEVKFMNPIDFGVERTEEQDEKVIIIMRNRKNQNENLIRAAMLSTEKILIPNSRHYVDPFLMKSIDLQFIKNFIFSTDIIKLNFFINNFLAPELKASKSLKDKVIILEKLSERGIFVRILLQELKDYGLQFYPTTSNRNLFKESRQFFAMLEKLANKEPDVDIPLDFNGKYIKIHIFLIGRSHVVYRKNEIQTGPYKKHIFNSEEKGIKVIYILALSHNVIAAKKISEELDEMIDRFKKISESNYKVNIRNEKMKAICFRYHVLQNI